jgi:hypothetical protein
MNDEDRTAVIDPKQKSQTHMMVWLPFADIRAKPICQPDNLHPQ